MSGGEKARLLLALATREAPHLLILDEPTNHLDIDARDALVKALTDFEGAVVLISHDPYLVDLVADRLLLVANGKVTPFEGDLAAYAASMSERAAPAAKQVEAKKNDKVARAEARAKLAPLRQAAKAAEQVLAKLLTEKESLEARLASEEIYTQAKTAELTKVTQRLAVVKREIDAAEHNWLEAHTALEEVEG